MPRALLFEVIAAEVATQISSGALKPGDRVRSVRTLSTQFGVAINTVLHAFATLEARGLVEARPQSGYFVSERAGAALAAPQTTVRSRPGVPRPIGERLPGFFHSMRDPQIANFGAACPGAQLLPAQKLGRVLARVARLQGPSSLGYDPLPGHAPLRRQIGRRLTAAGCAVGPEELLITVGAIEALHLALKATTRTGDTVIVESPGYFGVLQLLSELGLKAVEVTATAATGPALAQLEAAVRRFAPSAMVLIPNFSNPLGALMPPDAKRAVVALCAKHDVALIESDVYGELGFDGHRPPPLKAFDRTGHVLSCSSFSKTVAPGFRVGWIAPGRYFARVEELKFTQTVATPTITQTAMAEFLISGAYDRHLRALRRSLQSQLASMRAAVAEYFPKGTRASDPRGGFLLWVQLPRGCLDTLELQRRALAAGISFAPGVLFSARDGLTDCLRLSCGQPWTSKLERAIERLGRLATSS